MVASAIARANNAHNVLSEERAAFVRINTAVQLGHLVPLNAQGLLPLPKDDYGIGIVPFAELAKWGQSTTLYDFVRIAETEWRNGLSKPLWIPVNGAVTPCWF